MGIAQTLTPLIQIGSFDLLPPRSFKGDKSKELKLRLNAIQVVEENPTKGSTRINWVLHTNLPVDDYEAAIEKIRWYCLGWRIEVYFKVIKSGFNVEHCRLNTAERLIRYLAVVSIVAWRVLWLTLVSRTAPEGLGDEFLCEDEWKVLYVKFNPTKRIPKRPPPLKIFITWIAQLGGFLARKGDGSPGIIHMLRGLKKLSDMVLGLRSYQYICG